jgi:excisionase family DNA binding protein
VTELLTQEDVARLLRVSVRTVQRITARGELRAVYPARYPRYTARSVEAYQHALEGRKRHRVA